MPKRPTIYLSVALTSFAATALFSGGASAAPAFADPLGGWTSIEKVACWWDDGVRYCDDRDRSSRWERRRDWRGHHRDFYGYGGRPYWRDRDDRRGWRDRDNDED